jgi:hypothetical protein
VNLSEYENPQHAVPGFGLPVFLAIKIQSPGLPDQPPVIGPPVVGYAANYVTTNSDAYNYVANAISTLQSCGAPCNAVQFED